MYIPPEWYEGESKSQLTPKETAIVSAIVVVIFLCMTALMA